MKYKEFFPALDKAKISIYLEKQVASRKNGTELTPNKKTTDQKLRNYISTSTFDINSTSTTKGIIIFMI